MLNRSLYLEAARHEFSTNAECFRGLSRTGSHVTQSMLIKILKKLRQHLIRLFVVALVLLAAYVSVGRQFMPVISRYDDFFEEQILAITGLPVNVESLQGSFLGFNPSIQVSGFSLLVSEADQAGLPEESAFVFDQANLVIDIGRSIWQRRWVLEEFLVEGLAIEAEETESGQWQLNNIDFSEGGISPDELYRTFLQVAQLTLSNVELNLTTKDRNTFTFSNGTAIIQNRNGNHFLHVNANLDNSDEQFALSLEVRGEALNRVNGRLHLDMPETDYTNLFAGTAIGASALEQIVGGGEVWVSLQNGEIRNMSSALTLDTLALRNEESETVTDYRMTGNSRLTFGAGTESLDLRLGAVTVSDGELQWGPFNAHLAVMPDAGFELQADVINLALLSRLLDDSGLLGAQGRQLLRAYNPEGELANLNLDWPLADSASDAGRLSTNLQGVNLSSVDNAPALGGMDGYVEADYDRAAGLLRGFAEVESDRFRINIPSIFVDTWNYDYVNGRLDFRADLNDGQHIRLASNVVVANSSAVDGRVQFASTLNRYADGRRESELDLLVGALRVDVKQKELYLPNAPGVAPGLRNTMAWLEQAVSDGELRNSGVIYRGSTVPGAAPVTKTFQSFYALEDGDLQFSPQWPALENVSALVLTDDGEIDVKVNRAESLGIVAEQVAATLRVNEVGENWLEIRGAAGASTNTGLVYLQAAPLGSGLRDAISSWQASGDFVADIQVRVPFNVPERATEVRVQANLADNSLIMPDYALDIDQLTGPVIFDTVSGLEQTVLTGRLFEEPVSITLSSVLAAEELQAIQVAASGAVAPNLLADWPLQSAFVQRLLADTAGEFRYTAQVSVPLTGGDHPRLTLDSSLEGMVLNLPQPFAKTAASTLPLHLEIEFDGADQRISGLLGAEMSLNLSLEQGQFQNGLVAFGKDWTEVESQLNNETSGLAVLGRVAYLEVDEWVEYLTGMTAEGAATNEMEGYIAFIDVAVDTLNVYEQSLAGVALHIESDSSEGVWSIGLGGDTVSGRVNIPFAANDYLMLDLDYLHLPAGEESDVAVLDETDPVAAEPVDALAQIDPRTLPKMRFSARDVSIGERDFGRWQFTVDPDADGAEFSELSFDFRGLRLSPPTTEDVPPPRFSWRYDGGTHSSFLRGILVADNIADVLTANGIAPSLESSSARFITDINWPGTPAFFSASHLSGDLSLTIRDGRFQQEAGGAGALKLISIINFDALMRRLRFSDDLLRRGLAYDSITGSMRLDDGQVTIQDRLVISGPSSLYQITGELNLAEQTIDGEMYLTLPVSANIPWLGLLTANLPLAVGAYLFDRIFGDQVNNLTSAVYTLQGPWEGLQPQFKQAFGAPESAPRTPAAPAPAPQ